MPLHLPNGNVLRATVLVGLLCLISIACVAFAGYRVSTISENVEHAWEDFINESEKIDRSLLSISNLIGYGGIIHDFKNYVIRRDPKYAERLQASFTQLNDELSNLSHLVTTEEEEGYIRQVRTTFMEYQVKFELAQAHDTDTVDELDAAVRVSDENALSSLQKMFALNSQRRQEKLAELSNAQVKLDRAAYLNYAVVVVVSALSFVVVLLVQRREDSLDRAKLALRHADDLYDNSPDALVSVSTDGVIRRINGASHLLLGYSAEELVGEHIEMLVPAELREQHVGLRNAFLNAPENRWLRSARDLTAVRSDGSEIYVDISLTNTTAPDGKFIVAAIRDRTETHNLLADLRRMTDEAGKANATKSAFLASMSHEIRTPLNGILGILQLLEKDPLAQPVAEKLKIAKDSGLFLLALINQVLDFSRIEAGVFESTEEPIDLTALFDGLNSIFKPQCVSKGIDIVLAMKSDYPPLQGDLVHIQQILFNLIGNAIKFTDEGSVTICPHLSDLKDGKHLLSIDVTDTGSGIRKESQARIFERFGQTAEGKAKGGTGLGLAISHELATTLGGTLTVRSELGAGSTFTLTLPLAAGSMDDLIAQSHSSDSSISPMNILVAEDNKVNQLIIQSMLEGDGHLVTLAKDGQAAVETILGNPHTFDLVLMDIQMPKMDGIEATRTVRAAGVSETQLPIIALTANVFSDQVALYLAAGMQSVLMKPLKHANLVKALHYIASPEKAPDQVRDHSSTTEHPDHDESALDVSEFLEMMKDLPKDRIPGLISSLESGTRTVLASLRDPQRSQIEFKAAAHEMGGMMANFRFNRAAEYARDLEMHEMPMDERMELVERIGADIDTGLKQIRGIIGSDA
ncbi:response regulator [Rhodospirillaceae bacterium KN72]|uniref:histidine kinase n=1 Tax=Pacificispira spongiicola TaxID=2729598 RepID=A0A7Y0HG46_9PROT|nr:ATP-binding protein [Pacificispira spongiicola]NMM46506.1 response regulator [Pacificispira spongiicola]